MKSIALIVSLNLLLFIHLSAQQPDKIYMPSIHSVKLFISGNQSAYPIIQLNSVMSLELHFDDLTANVKNYNYTYVLCDAKWAPVDLSPFDFLQGFTQGRLSQYRASSVAKTKYIHYQALLPDKSCTPKLSGNYLLKVYLNGDTSKLAFTRRMLVLDNILSIGAKVTQPFATQLFRTHQKIQFTFDKTKLNVLNPQQQIKIVVLQNYRWDNAVTGIQPTFMRGNIFEYSSDNTVFPGGREYRWVDLRSFRFQSERVDSANLNTLPFNVYLKPDPQRTNLRYVTYVDLNGAYEINATDVNNPWWQGDYANVHFTFVPQNAAAFSNEKVYLIGELATGNCDNAECELDYNPDKKVFEKTLLLKQGYYYYTYVTKSINNKKIVIETQDTEGNYSETENSYTILVYYRSFSDRSDELVGATTIDSRNMIQGQ
jgi:type 9 secretion system plug protein